MNSYFLDFLFLMFLYNFLIFEKKTQEFLIMIAFYHLQIYINYKNLPKFY